MKNCDVNEQRKNDSFPMVKFNMNAAVFSLFLQPLHKFLKKIICSVGDSDVKCMSLY